MSKRYKRYSRYTRPFGPVSTRCICYRKKCFPNIGIPIGNAIWHFWERISHLFEDAGCPSCQPLPQPIALLKFKTAAEWLNGLAGRAPTHAHNHGAGKDRIRQVAQPRYSHRTIGWQLLGEDLFAAHKTATGDGALFA